MNNQAAEITGILTFKENTFMQFLEGPELNLKRTFAKIKKDTRHCHIDILRMCTISQRQFENWHMKYIPIKSVEMGNNILHEKLFRHGVRNNHSLDLAVESRAIILTFKQAKYYPQKFRD